MKTNAFVFATLSLAACAPMDVPSQVSPAGLQYVRIGQTVTIGGPRVTPLALVEDSRCPQGVQCVWAGQVRITARVTTGAGAQVLELTTGKPVRIADGTLVLAGVLPAKRKNTAPAPGDYRFGFRFDGGL